MAKGDEVMSGPFESSGSPTFDEKELFGDDLLSGVEMAPLEDAEAPWERYDKKKRMGILLISSIPMLLQPFATTMVVPSFNNIQLDLDTVYTMVVLTVVGYNLMAGIFPMFYGPLSDCFGRKFLWYFTLPAFAVAATASGFAPNIWLLILGRSLLGAFSCSVVIVGTGIVTDICSPENQGKALGLQVSPLGGERATLTGVSSITSKSLLSSVQ